MPAAKLSSLIALTDEPSSKRRREVLRELTDPLFADAPASTSSSTVESSGAEAEEFDVPASAIARSTFLTQDDLMMVARRHDQPHLRLLAERGDLSDPVVEAVIARADEATLGVLLRNPAAPLSRRAAESAVDRAAANPDLHDAAVSRPDLPAELLNELYLLVEPGLRAKIRARNADLAPAAFERALESGRKRLEGRSRALPADHAEAYPRVRALIDAGIAPDALAALAAEEGRTALRIALAELGRIDFHTAGRIDQHRELDALAIVCRAAELEGDLFLAFVLLVAEPAGANDEAAAYGRLYAELPSETARRTLRFWRMRRQTGDVAPAEAA